MGFNGFCDVEDKGNNSPQWTNFDLFMRHAVPELMGGGIPYARRFKTAFVVHNRYTIIAAAQKYRLPPELLAGVAWIESGGKPNSWKGEIYNQRIFRDGFYSGGKPADRTSFGFLSMQIHTAAETLGLDPNTLGVEKQIQIALCLEHDTYIIDLAARHLRMLADHDKFDVIGTEEIRVLGARYNQGISRSLEQIKKDLSYGNFIVNNWHSYTLMLSGVTVE